MAKLQPRNFETQELIASIKAADGGFLKLSLVIRASLTR